ncbi:hypothetical protein SK128_013074, partial [Halocaridina rubra]
SYTRCGLGTEVRYSHHRRLKFRVKGDQALFLTSPGTRSSLTLASDTGSGNQWCFRVHRYVVGADCPDDGGYVVILETERAGSFVSATASRRLFIM